MSLSVINDPLRQGVSILKRVEAEKFDYPDHVVDARLGVSFFPIHDRHLVATDHFCRFDLTEIQIEPPFSDHLADGLWVLRIPLDPLEI